MPKRGKSFELKKMAKGGRMIPLKHATGSGVLNALWFTCTCRDVPSDWIKVGPLTASSALQHLSDHRLCQHLKSTEGVLALPIACKVSSLFRKLCKCGCLSIFFVRLQGR